MNYIGIDPGVKGAISYITSDGKYDVFDIPTIVVKKGKKNKTMVNLIELNILMGTIIKTISTLCNEKDIPVKIESWLESVHSMPQQGVSSMFSMGRTLGNLEMVLTCHNININWVTPQKWKKEIIFGDGADKMNSITEAEKIFPNAILKTPRGRILDGRAEALLIAEYGRRLDRNIS